MYKTMPLGESVTQFRNVPVQVHYNRLGVKIMHISNKSFNLAMCLYPSTWYSVHTTFW